MTKFEYGIRASVAVGVHRQGMTEEEAWDWLNEWIEMGGTPDMFSVICRPLGDWAPAPQRRTNEEKS